MAVSRRWHITVPLTGREKWPEDWSWADKIPHKFIIYSQECGSKTGYQHYQMYIECTKPVRPSAIKKVLGNDVHIEKAKGSAEDNIEYISKPETHVAGPWRCGETHKESVTNMWEAMRDPKVRTSTILEECGYSPLAFPQVDKTRKLLRAEDRAHTERKKPFIHVIYGPPRAGKTEYVKRLLKSVPLTEKFWASKDPKVFWEGYDGQKHFIFDECDKNTEAKCSEGLVLGMLDDTPCTINIKFGVAHFASEHVWFIGNSAIDHCYLEPLVSESLRERVKENGEYIYITKDTRDALPSEIRETPSSAPPAPPSVCRAKRPYETSDADAGSWSRIKLRKASESDFGDLQQRAGDCDD